MRIVVDLEGHCPLARQRERGCSHSPRPNEMAAGLEHGQVLERNVEGLERRLGLKIRASME